MGVRILNNIEQLQQIIDNTNNIVFFGGAGVSTESGIPDFRSVDGLYHQKYDYPPETILSHTFFKRQTKEFYRFYRDKMLVLDAEPNAAHKKLAELEECGKLKAVVTQNIDGLHQKAGSKRVLELHGSIHRNYCQRCHACFDGKQMQELLQSEDGLPHCFCGGVIKPDVVLYEEGLDQKTMQDSIRYISQADVLIIGGTSLAVYPAAGLIDYFQGRHLVVINMAPTPRDRHADLLIQEKIGTVLGALHV
ncbi:MAG: NAD-dependent protein deacylase [Lachnospiraceae bacterium]|nr:NAD-dependent protein deacylase [Lachnospiraceae bacterium]